jgi:hypothetical protein
MRGSIVGIALAEIAPLDFGAAGEAAMFDASQNSRNSRTKVPR